MSISEEDVKELLHGIGIPARFGDLIRCYLKPLNVRKGDYFCLLGESADKIGFLVKGFLVATYINERGNNYTSRFYHPSKNRIVSNHFSFVNDVAATETIRARLDSELLVIHKEDLDRLLEEILDLRKYITRLAEYNYLEALNRIHDLQSLSAEQRVRKFVKSNKALLQIATKSDISSYLGMNRNLYNKFLLKC